VTGPVLGLDTATGRATVAVGDATRVWHEGVLDGARRQAAELLPLVQRVLGEARVRVADLNGIVVGDGPGSFTGLRIGFALARGLAHERGLGVAAVPSLMGHAHAASAGLAGAPVAACFDALRGQVFGAVYAFPQGSVEMLVTPDVMTVGELMARAPRRPARIVGDGAERYAAQLSTWIDATVLPPRSSPARTVAWSLIALHALAGRTLDDPATAEPIYGRPAEAQVRWEARHGRPLPDSSR